MAERRGRRGRGASRGDATPSQPEHRADDLDSARLLDPVSHLYMLREWPVTCDTFAAAVDATGLGLIRHLGRIILDHRLITALVERWNPSTNTFVLPVGEMTVTLQDVAIILGVRIDGQALIGPPAVGPGCSWETWPDCCDQLLGEHPIADFNYVNPADHNDFARFKMGQAASQTCLPLRWLKWRFSRNTYANLTIPQLNQCVRAYVLYMIGCFLLPDTSGSEVHLQWLPLLEDLNAFSQFSIGGAVLAHLYRELTESVKPSRASIAGCLHLLQVWSWEHIYIGRPTTYVPGWTEVVNMPLGYRWSEGWTREHPMRALVYYRNDFDTLQSSQVIWEPYTTDICSTLPAICTAGHGIWLARVPLICWVRVEWYLPDRVMRQFGYQQHTDLEFIPTSFKRVDARGKAGTNWLHYHRKECNIWEHRYEFITEPTFVDSSELRALSEYMLWYKSWARLYLVNIPSEEPQTYYPRAGIEREYEHFRHHTVTSLRPHSEVTTSEEWLNSRQSILSLSDELQHKVHIRDYEETYGSDQPYQSPVYEYDQGTSHSPYGQTNVQPSYSVFDWGDEGPPQTQYTQDEGWGCWPSTSLAPVPSENDDSPGIEDGQGAELDEGGGNGRPRRATKEPNRYTPGLNVYQRKRKDKR